jgi:hypothetical protein
LGREGWLALPAVVLVGIAQFQIDLLLVHIPTMWYPFGVGITLRDVASAALSLVIFILILRRLQQSLERQRLLALDLKQAPEVQQVLLPETRATCGVGDHKIAPKVPGTPHMTFQIRPAPSRSSDLSFERLG